jgi:hypothetical protein
VQTNVVFYSVARIVRSWLNFFLNNVSGICSHFQEFSGRGVNVRLIDGAEKWGSGKTLQVAGSRRAIEQSFADKNFLFQQCEGIISLRDIVQGRVTRLPKLALWLYIDTLPSTWNPWHPGPSSMETGPEKLVFPTIRSIVSHLLV